MATSKKTQLLLIAVSSFLILVPSAAFAKVGDSQATGTVNTSVTSPTPSPASTIVPSIPEKRAGHEMEQKERQNFKAGNEELRAKFSADIEKRKADFKANLAKIKDERKKNIVTNVNEKMSRINKNRTDHWKKVITELTGHLNKIKAKRDEVKNSGKDTSSVDSAITTAQGKIDAASAAVDAQAAKEYVLTIGTETELKNTVGAAIKGEQTDLKGVQDTIEQARKSVRDALISLMKLKGEKIPDPATQTKETTTVTQ